MLGEDYNGTKLEYHEVTTEDGYILKLMRLLETNKDSPQTEINNLQNVDSIEYALNENVKVSQKRRPPILFVHGAVNFGSTWILNDPEKNLPNKLASKGFDCWLANLRGTPLSKRHITLKNNSRKYWDFCMDEISCFDLPSIINHILDTTEAEQIYYVGNSLGTFLFFIMMSFKPEFNSKIKAMVAIAPAFYLNHFRNKCLNFCIPFAAIFMSKSRYIRETEACQKFFADIFSCCCLSSNFTVTIASTFMMLISRLIGAFGKNQVENNMMKKLIKCSPASTSLKTLLHVTQNIYWKRVAAFDYGRSENLKRYGQIDSPTYDIKKTTVPVATFYSESDQICTAADVTQLSKDLPNSIGNYGIKNPKFAHCELMVGKDAHIIFDSIVTLMESLEAGVVKPISVAENFTVV